MSTNLYTVLINFADHIVGIGQYETETPEKALELFVQENESLENYDRERLMKAINPLIHIRDFKGFWIASFGHFHKEISEKVAASSLILMLGMSPCLVVAPFFIIIGPLGIAGVVQISILMSVLSVAGMTLMGWLAVKGLDILKLEWLERNESRIMGSLLMLMGITFIIL